MENSCCCPSGCCQSRTSTPICCPPHCKPPCNDLPILSDWRWFGKYKHYALEREVNPPYGQRKTLKCPPMCEELLNSCSGIDLIREEMERQKRNVFLETVLQKKMMKERMQEAPTMKDVYAELDFMYNLVAGDNGKDEQETESDDDSDDSDESEFELPPHGVMKTEDMVKYYAQMLKNEVKKNKEKMKEDTTDIKHAHEYFSLQRRPAATSSNQADDDEQWPLLKPVKPSCAEEQYQTRAVKGMQSSQVRKRTLNLMAETAARNILQPNVKQIGKSSRSYFDLYAQLNSSGQTQDTDVTKKHAHGVYDYTQK